MNVSNSVSMHLRQTYMTMHRFAQAQLAPYGVTADQYVVLSLLAEQDGVRQQELADKACSDANTIAAMLQLLEEKKLIQRRPDKQDRRAKIVRLTAKGKRLQVELLESVGPVHAALRQAVGREDWDTFLACLQRIREVVSVHGEQNFLAG